MKQLMIIVMSLLAIMARAQEDYRERINLNLTNQELAISPKGIIALGTNTAIYVTDAPEKGWRGIPLSVNRSGSSIEDLCWSSENVLIASVGGKLYAWETADDGTFKPLTMSNAPRAYNLRSDGHGHVWAWGLSTKVFYSSDSGRSWNEIAHIQELEDLDHYVNDLYFDNNGKRGLIGSNYNELYLTRDNGKTLQRIPTPLDQKAYQQSEEAAKRTRINKVRIFGDYYIVEQDYKAFITSTKDIRWRPTNGSDTASGIDVMSNRFIVIRPDAGTVRLLDEKLNLVNEFKVPEEKRDIAYGDDMYIIDKTALHKCGINGNKRYELFRTDQEIDPMNADEPSRIFTIDGQEFYFDSYDLIAKSKATGKWYRYMTFDFEPFKPFEGKGKLFFYNSFLDDEMTLYQLNVKEKTIKPYEWPSKMFGRKKVVGMQVIYSVIGCFVNSGINKENRLDGDNLVWVKDYTIGNERNNAYSELPKQFKASNIQRLVALIDESRSHEQAYTDTLITDEDRAEYVKLIDEFLEDDDVNIFKYMDISDKWIAAGEQITALNENWLKQAREDASSSFSTTTVTRKILFTFEDRSSMSCHNDKWRVSYLYSPWTITYGNFVYVTEDLNVSSLINQITQGKMLDQRYCSKAFAIYQMVKQQNGNSFEQ